MDSVLTSSIMTVTSISSNQEGTMKSRMSGLANNKMLLNSYSKLPKIIKNVQNEILAHSQNKYLRINVKKFEKL